MTIWIIITTKEILFNNKMEYLFVSKKDGTFKLISGKTFWANYKSLEYSSNEHIKRMLHIQTYGRAIFHSLVS